MGDDRKDLEDSEATTTAAPEAASAHLVAAEEADLPSTGGPIKLLSFLPYYSNFYQYSSTVFFNLPFTLIFSILSYGAKNTTMQVSLFQGVLIQYTQIEQVKSLSLSLPFKSSSPKSPPVPPPKPPPSPPPKKKKKKKKKS